MENDPADGQGEVGPGIAHQVGIDSHKSNGKRDQRLGRLQQVFFHQGLKEACLIDESRCGHHDQGQLQGGIPHIDVRIFGDQIPEVVCRQQIDHLYRHFFSGSTCRL